MKARVRRCIGSEFIRPAPTLALVSSSTTTTSMEMTTALKVQPSVLVQPQARSQASLSKLPPQHQQFVQIWFGPIMTSTGRSTFCQRQAVEPCRRQSTNANLCGRNTLWARCPGQVVKQNLTPERSNLTSFLGFVIWHGLENCTTLNLEANPECEKRFCTRLAIFY